MKDCANPRCSSSFEPKNARQLYCDTDCANRAKSNRRYSELNPESRQRRREWEAAKHQERSARYRSQVFAAYGGRCQCCGETEQAFLQLDHIDRDGADHRRNVIGRREGAGYWFYAWVVRNNFPSGLQILCANCNTAKERPGGCPHQRGIDGF